MKTPHASRWPRLAWAAAALSALLAVFALYLQPELAVTLANQLWNCL